MKIRNGFVSNSSSSSFVLFGVPLDAKNVTNSMLKNNRITAIGCCLDEGLDVFTVRTDEELAFIKACEKLEKLGHSCFSLYDTFLYGEGENTVDLSKLPKSGTAVLIGGDQAQGSSDGLNDLFENYCNNNELVDEKIRKEMQKYLRAKKLKNLKTSK